MATVLDYETYKRLRSDGLSPSEAMTQLRSFNKESPIDGLISTMIGVFIGVVLMCSISKRFRLPLPSIWVTSPSGKTTVEMPLYQAMRMVNKRHWKYTDVEPVKPPRKVSRLEALKILIIGDKSK